MFEPGTAQSSMNDTGLQLVAHRHHDIEAGGAKIGEGGLQSGHTSTTPPHCAPSRSKPRPRSPMSSPSLRQPSEIFGFSRRTRRAAGPRPPFQDGFERWSEHGDFAAGPIIVHPPARPRSALVGRLLCRIHCRIERAEMGHAERALALQRREFISIAVEKASVPSEPTRICARLITAARCGGERIELYPPTRRWTFGKGARPRRPRGRRSRGAPRQALPIAWRPVLSPVCPRRSIGRNAPPAIGKHGIDGEDIIAGGAIAERAATAGIVAGHAADRGARGGRHVYWETTDRAALGLAVQVVEDDAGFDGAAPVRTSSERNAVRYLEQSMTGLD